MPQQSFPEKKWGLPTRRHERGRERGIWKILIQFKNMSHARAPRHTSSRTGAPGRGRGGDGSARARSQQKDIPGGIERRRLLSRRSSRQQQVDTWAWAMRGRGVPRVGGDGVPRVLPWGGRGAACPPVGARGPESWQHPGKASGGAGGRAARRPSPMQRREAHALRVAPALQRTAGPQRAPLVGLPQSLQGWTGTD